MLCIPLFSEIGRQYPIYLIYSILKHFILFGLIIFDLQKYYNNECPIGDEWPDTVPCDEHGAMLIPELIKLVEFFVSKEYPPIMVMTIGTTFTVSIYL